MRQFLAAIFGIGTFVLVSGNMAFGSGGAKLGAADGKDVIVELDPHSGLMVASGALGTARSEPLTGATSQKSIGCWIDATDNFAMITCRAEDDAGATLTCSSRNQYMVAAIGAINSDSFIRFSIDASSGTFGACKVITVDNSSTYRPKSP